MSEYINPQWAKAFQQDKTVGMPLFDSVRAKPAPPMVKTRSRSKNQVYHDRVNDGTLAASRNKILEMIRKHGGINGITIQDLNEKHGVPINEASGRTSELVDLGYVIILGKQHNPKTNRPNTLYRAAILVPDLKLKKAN